MMINILASLLESIKVLNYFSKHIIKEKRIKKLLSMNAWMNVADLN